MSTYNPDCWKIIKLTSKEHGTHYRVLCSWAGGYLHGNSWKISSGIEDIKDAGKFFELPQTSGSTYMLSKTGERVSMIMANIFKMYSDQAKNEDNSEMALSIEMIDWDDFEKQFKDVN